jgi:hypothetical protein
MASSSQVLVLVADEKSAKLYANKDGVTRLLRLMDRVSPVNDAGDEDHKSASALHVFACELMMALGRCLREQDCDGVVIFAEAPMMEELRLVQTGTVARRLLAQIVGKPTESSRFPGLSAANAQLAYCGGLQ